MSRYILEGVSPKIVYTSTRFFEGKVKPLVPGYYSISIQLLVLATSLPTLHGGFSFREESAWYVWGCQLRFYKDGRGCMLWHCAPTQILYHAQPLLLFYFPLWRCIVPSCTVVVQNKRPVRPPFQTPDPLATLEISVWMLLEERTTLDEIAINHKCFWPCMILILQIYVVI